MGALTCPSAAASWRCRWTRTRRAADDMVARSGCAACRVLRMRAVSVQEDTTREGDLVALEDHAHVKTAGLARREGNLVALSL